MPIYILRCFDIPNYYIPMMKHRLPRVQYTARTVHNLIEIEFYDIENFFDRDNFINKAYSYQLFFNLSRPNSYKENKTPWQLAVEKQPKLSKK